MDVDDLLRRVQSGLDEGDFTLLYLWITFRANGGCACRADLDAFARGLQALSDNDALVLGSVIEERVRATGARFQSAALPGVVGLRLCGRECAPFRWRCSPTWQTAPIWTPRPTPDPAGYSRATRRATHAPGHPARPSAQTRHPAPTRTNLRNTTTGTPSPGTRARRGTRPPPHQHHQNRSRSRIAVGRLRPRRPRPTNRGRTSKHRRIQTT